MKKLSYIKCINWSKRYILQHSIAYCCTDPGTWTEVDDDDDIAVQLYYVLIPLK